MDDMRKTMSVLCVCMIAMMMQMAGCGNSAYAESQSESSSPAQAETTASAEGMPSDESESTGSQTTGNETDKEKNSEMTMLVQVGGATFTATLEENAAVDELVEMMETAPVTIEMSDYAGFEKVGDLGRSLPTSNRQTTTRSGDIVLYQGNQIVMFYGSNSWSYTRLGHIDDLTGWEQALGSGDVTVTFSLEAQK